MQLIMIDTLQTFYQQTHRDNLLLLNQELWIAVILTNVTDINGDERQCGAAWRLWDC
jgi:hypothetical protein